MAAFIWLIVLVVTHSTEYGVMIVLATLAIICKLDYNKESKR